eukprot:11758462-Alexandrium_andersonii.AAC.1
MSSGRDGPALSFQSIANAAVQEFTSQARAAFHMHGQARQLFREQAQLEVPALNDQRAEVRAAIGSLRTSTAAELQAIRASAVGEFQAARAGSAEAERRV